MGGFFGGILQGFERTQDDIRKEEARRDAEEQEMLQALLKSPNAEIQRYALTSLLQGPKDRKKAAKGLRGWLGETERSPHYQQLTALEQALNPPQAQQVQPVEGPTPLPTRVDRLVGAPEAPQVQTTGAPVPGTPSPEELMYFGGRLISPTTTPEAAGIVPPDLSGYVGSIPSHELRKDTLYREQLAALEGAKQRHYEGIAAGKRRAAESEKARTETAERDARLEEARIAREEFSQTRQDRRQARTDARIIRLTQEARGETGKRDARRFYQQDKRDAKRGYDKYVAGLNKYGTARPEDLAEAKVEYDQELLQIEKDYAEELRGGGGGGAPPVGQPGAALPSGWTIRKKQ